MLKSSTILSSLSSCFKPKFWVINRREFRKERYQNGSDTKINFGLQIVAYRLTDLVIDVGYRFSWLSTRPRDESMNQVDLSLIICNLTSVCRQMNRSNSCLHIWAKEPTDTIQ